MRKQEIIDRLMFQDPWDEIYKHFALIGMEKSTKKELLLWLDDENNTR